MAGLTGVWRSVLWWLLISRLGKYLGASLYSKRYLQRSWCSVVSSFYLYIVYAICGVGFEQYHHRREGPTQNSQVNE